MAGKYGTLIVRSLLVHLVKCGKLMNKLISRFLHCNQRKDLGQSKRLPWILYSVFYVAQKWVDEYRMEPVLRVFKVKCQKALIFWQLARLTSITIIFPWGFSHPPGETSN